MRKMIRHATVLIAVAALAAVSLGCANSTEQSQEERMAEHVTEHVEEALDELQATDAQRERIRGLADDLIEQFKSFHADHRATHAKVKAMWLADRADPKQAHALVDERIDAVRSLAHTVTDAVLQLHDTLTPEQRQAVVERVEERRRHWHDRWHRDQGQ